MIARAASLIKKGGIVIFPTSSFYGLGANAFNGEAVDKVFRVKKRDPKKPVLILIASLADLAPLVRSIPNTGKRLMEAFWPGSLTLVFHAADFLPSNLTGCTGKIGIRLAGHPVACALLKLVGSAITGTSANLSGKGGCITVAEVDHYIRNQVDLVLDAGRLGGGQGSTVVDVTVDPPKILREGAIDAEKIWGRIWDVLK
ncbi:MAG: threonylcarbamoyl-AMP synthase [Desulfobacterales bacterium]|nr:threonylcarbamoyl-AMP synthase [Desulfobacterales bacterium]